MKILVTGLSHKTAPVEIREKIVLNEQAGTELLRELIAVEGIREVLAISTCNRVEIVCIAEPPFHGALGLMGMLAKKADCAIHQLWPYLYVFAGEDALRHIFRVSCGLDSLALGEPQIMGQVKDSFFLARRTGVLGNVLSTIMERAFQVAKRVRSETGIGRAAVSIPSAAVELARKIFGSLDKRKALVIGAGEMSELALEHFISNGARNPYIFNRDSEKASKLATRFQATVVSRDKLDEALLETDIVLSCTSAEEYVLTVEKIRPIIKKRRYRSLFVIDIAVPRDIDPEIGRFEEVFLYCIDDLEAVVQANLAERKLEAGYGERIIREAARDVIRRMKTLDASPLIIALRDKVHRIKEAELRRRLDHLDRFAEEDKEYIRFIATSIINKILHDPTICIKRAYASGDESRETLEAAKELFKLDIDVN